MRTIFSITQEGPEAKRQAGGYSDGPMEQAALVVPGEMIASSKYWMRGHGTFIEEQAPSQTDDEMASDSTHPAEGLIRSSLAGTVERINKLITVSPLSGRYRPEVGDLVIGRITEVQSKRWKVEAGARQHAVLMLGSVNLPGGVQRRKLESDELQMRFFFQEGDLLVAEVQGFFGDGSMSLHTRSRKYGKLRNGMLLKVPPQLILRLKSHFHILPIGIDLIIGVNGWIWIAQQRAEAVPDESLNEAFEADSDNMYSDVNEPISSKTRENIARLAGAINLLSTHSMPISDVSILRTYEASLEVSRLSRLSAAADDAGHQQMELDDSHDHPPTAPQHLDDFLKAEFRDRVLALLVASD